MRFFWIISLTAMLLANIATSAAAQERALREARAGHRIAVLIGNANYNQTMPASNLKPLKVLRNPCDDVIRIAGTLEAGGWNPDTEIIQVCDASRMELKDAIDRFKDIYLSNDRTFGFIFYSGHGVQLGDETYLFGTDSAIDVVRAANIASTHSSGNIFRGGVRLFADVIKQVGDAGTGSIFIVVDACRETPIDKYLRTTDHAALAQMPQRTYPRPALGIKLLYSTAYGELASDGVAGGSPFALAFEEKMKNFGNVDLLVSHVIKSVKEKTQNLTIAQIPDTTGALNPPPPEACLFRCGETQ